VRLPPALYAVVQPTQLLLQAAAVELVFTVSTLRTVIFFIAMHLLLLCFRIGPSGALRDI